MRPIPDELARFGGTYLTDVTQVRDGASLSHVSGAITAIPTATNTERGLHKHRVFDVEDFGALPSPANATVAFQAAVSAASAAGGGVVEVPAGKVFLLSGLVLATGITLRGQGGFNATSCVKLFGSSGSMILLTDRQYNTTIAKLTLLGPDVPGGTAIRCEAGAADQYNVTLTDITAWNWDYWLRVGGEVGVFQNKSYHQMTVKRVLAISNIHGAHFNAANVTGLTIRDCSLLAVTGPAIYLEDIGYACLSGISGAGGAVGSFIDVAFTRNPLRIDHCQSEGTGYFLRHFGGSGVQAIILRECMLGDRIHLTAPGTKLTIDNCVTGGIESGYGVVCEDPATAEITIIGRLVHPSHVSLNTGSRVIDLAGHLSVTSANRLGFPLVGIINALTTGATVAAEFTADPQTYTISGVLHANSADALTVSVVYDSVITGATTKTLLSGVPAAGDTPFTFTCRPSGGVVQLVVTRSTLTGTALLSYDIRGRGFVPTEVDPTVINEVIRQNLSGPAGSWLSDSANRGLTGSILAWGSIGWWGFVLSPVGAAMTSDWYDIRHTIRASSTADQRLQNATETAYKSVYFVARCPTQPHAQAWQLLDTVSASSKMATATADGTTWDTSGGWTHYCDGVATETIPNDGFRHVFQAVSNTNTETGLVVGGVNAWPEDLFYVAVATGIESAGARAVIVNQLFLLFTGSGSIGFETI